MILEAMRRIRALERRLDDVERQNAELRQALQRPPTFEEAAPAPTRGRKRKVGQG